MKRLISLLGLVFFGNHVIAQSQQTETFGQYLDPAQICKKQIKLDKDSVIFETTYLGVIQVDSNEYDVLSQFYSAPAANCRHGHSRVIFVHRQNKTSHIYTLNMPEELPTGISANQLRLDDKAFEPFENGLPLMLCIPDGGCYEAEE